MASFKDYIVNYELNVRPVGIESAFSAVKQFSEQVAAPIESVSKAVKGISGAIKSLKETTGSDKKFIFEARTNAQGFQAQLDALVKMAAEKGREASRAFQAGMSLTGAGGKAGAAGVISQGEKKGLEDLIKKRAELQKQLENKYYKDVTSRKTGKVTRQEKAPSKTKAPQAYAEYKALKDEMFAVNRTIEDLEKMKAQTGRKLAALKTSAAPKATVTPVASTSGFDQKWIAKQLKGGSKTVTLTIKAVDQTKNVLANVAAGLQNLAQKAVIDIVPVINPEAFAQAENRMNGLLNRANAIRNALSAPLVANQPKGGMLGLTQKELQKYLENDKKIAQYRKDLESGKIIGSAAGRAQGAMMQLEKQNQRFREKVSTAMVPTQTLGAVGNLITESEKAVAAITPSTKSGKATGKGRTGAVAAQQQVASLANTVQQIKPIITINANTLPALQKLAELVNAINKNKNHVISVSAKSSAPLQIAAKNTTNLDTKVVSTGQAGFNLNQHLQKLQQLANSRPIKLTTVLTPSATGVSGGNAVVSAANTGTSTTPATGTKKDSWDKRAKSLGAEMKKTQKEAIARQKAREDYARQVAAERQAYPNMYAKLLDERDAEQARQQKALFAEQRKRAEQLQKQRAAAERTRASIEALREKEAIKTAAIAERERIKNEMRASQPSRTVTAMYGGNTANTGTPRSAWAQRKASMNGFAYQLMGNTSLGARTPVFLDMMKGMGMMTGVGAAMSTLTNAFTNASEYQNTMVTARAILEANYQGGNFAGDFKNMERIVRDVAKKTKFTAPQAADAARFMAMAGLNIPMINSSIRPIADVAVIGDNDLGEVADKITNIQTAFGIKPNKMRALADALTKTFTSSNTDMMMLAESMEYAAPMAHLAGAQVEDALAMIGIMGNAGIQGSMAGTTLRMMYQNIINPNKKQQGMWKSLGINLRDENGNPRQLMDILGDLRQKVRISREDKDEEGNFKDEGTPIAEAVSKLFRVTASAGAGTLLENLDKVIALAEANRNAAGLSQRISEVKQNDVKGMWAKMTSAFTDAVVTEFEGQNNPIKGYIENLTKYFNSSDFKEMLHDIFDIVTSMMDVLVTFAKIWKGIYDIFGPIIKYTMMAQFILTQIGYLLAPFRSVWLTLSKGYGAATGLAGIGGAVGGTALNGALSPLTKNTTHIGTTAIAASALSHATYSGQFSYGRLSRNANGLMDVTKATNTAFVRTPYAQSTYAPLQNPYLVANPLYTPLPVGTRNLEKTRRKVEKADRVIAQAKEGEARYLAQRSRGHKNYQKWEHLQVSSQAQAIIAQQEAIKRSAGAVPFVPMPYLNFNNPNNKAPFRHGRTVNSVTRTLSTNGVMPFNKYANNASAILYGAESQARFGVEYRKRADAWGKWANMTDEQLKKKLPTKYQGNIASFRAMAAQRAATYGKEAEVWRHMYELEVARQMMTTKKAEEMNAAKEKRMLSKKPGGAVYERARKIYGYKHTPGRAFTHGFSRAFHWGITGFSMASMMGGLTKIIGALGKALGALLNPITLVVGGLALFGYKMWQFSKEVSEVNEKLRKESAAYGELLRQSIDNALGKNDVLSKLFPNIHTVTVDTATINVNNEQKESSVAFSKRENVSQINELIDKYAHKRIGGTGFYLSKWGKPVVDRETAINWKNDIISPLLGITPGLSTSSWKDDELIANIIKADYGQQALESPKYAETWSKIEELYGEFVNLPDNEQLSKWSDYVGKINELVEYFNPSNRPYLKDITSTNALSMRNTSPLATTSYWGTAYNSLKKRINEGNYIKSIEALKNIKNTNNLNKDELLYNLGVISGSIPISLPGLDSDVTLGFANGKYQVGGLSEINQRNKLNIPNIDEYAVSLIRGIFQQLPEIPGIKDKIEQVGVNEEEFVRYTLGYGSKSNYFRANSPYDKLIDNQYINQSDYRSSYSGGQQRPVPTMYFTGPLIKIDSIKGGDGVKADEVKDVVQEAVTDTIKTITTGKWFSW